jgi:hypothetical protein
MLESLTVDTFSARIGERFRLHADPGSATPLELIDATPLGAARPAQAAGRIPFSLLFRGPLTPVWPQRIYRVDHDALGSLDLFLVPIGPRDGGMVYEAIFT